MTEIEKIVYTACVTLIGGVILLVFTELVKSYIMAPVQRMREQIQAALSKVDFHCNMLTNFFPAEPNDQEWNIIRAIKKDLREAATELKSKYTMVPFKSFLSALRLIPTQREIDIAYQGLIYLHNSILYKEKRDYVDNQIDMNHNQIDRIHAALTHKRIPALKKLKEKTR